MYFLPQGWGRIKVGVAIIINNLSKGRSKSDFFRAD